MGWAWGGRGKGMGLGETGAEGGRGATLGFTCGLQSANITFNISTTAVCASSLAKPRAVLPCCHQEGREVRRTGMPRIRSWLVV